MIQTPTNQRGSALAETAITMSFTMLCLLGAMQIALLGFFQLELDGATFFYTHQFAAGSTSQANVATALQGIFPTVPVVSFPLPGHASPPGPEVPTNFIQWGSLTNRFGGASILRRERTNTSASLPVNNLSILGASVNLSASGVEGQAVVSNHDDDAQGILYDSNAAYNSLVNPLTVDDQNVPPYYFTLAFLWHCNTFNNASANCTGNRELRSLGLAEFLKNDNYNTPANGVGVGGTFYYMACHQRIYADLANAFPAVRPAPPIPGNYASFKNGPYDETEAAPVAAPGASHAFSLLYQQWDHAVVGESASPTAGQNFPLDYEAGC